MAIDCRDSFDHRESRGRKLETSPASGNGGAQVGMMESGSRENKSFIEQYEFLIPLVLFAVFLAVTLPGISWGAPDGWHPDEIVVRSIQALHGEWQFSEINFDYPDLPQYAMFFLGKLILALGYTDTEILIASRVLSAVVAGLGIVLTYVIARRMGGSVRVAGTAGLLLLCVSELTHNGRFAHNDTYLVFFTTLAVLFLVNYKKSSHRGWLYASFFTVGMAASSKYNGISLAVVPLALFLFTQREAILKDRLRALETLFIGGAMTYLGFAFGTPKALTWMAYFFKRMIPALLRTGNYARQPDSVRGIIGQYDVFSSSLGAPLYLLFMAALIWAVYKLVQAYWSKGKMEPQTGIILIILLSILALDLPIMISYNYQTRFFLPLMPLFAVLAAFFIGQLYEWAGHIQLPQIKWALGAVIMYVVLISFARNISVMLLFKNDARIPASEFLRTLPRGTTLERTYYRPSSPENHFAREHDYPLHFFKTPGEELPVSPYYVFNQGEAGLDARMTDYLVVDSFISTRFNNPYVCESIPVECEFFKKLETGRSDHYQLIAEFKYTLPPYLPRISVGFVNPTIRIYERIK
jgi:hypothetical protein